MIELLRAHKVIVCAGTGGVGKTTMSAALGVLAARSGLKTLVITIDPAHRLAQALGLENKPGEEVPVPDIPGLSAVMIDARREFDEFVLGAVDHGVAKSLFKNRLYQQLASNLSGSQEFTSLVKLNRLARGNQYDLLILDTPPTQNAVDFLRAPEKIYALFQDTVIGWFANPTQDENWIKRTLHRGTRLVTGALESATGSTFIAELKDFFNHIAHLKAKIADIAESVRDLLHGPRTGFILVTGFDEAKLKEALEFQQDLAQEGLHLRALIVNRWFPEWIESEGSWSPGQNSDPDFQKLREFYERFATHFRRRQEELDRFLNQLGKDVPVLKLPDFKNTVLGIQDLKHVADLLEEKWNARK
ncbi:MAG TPA: ArsA family ATPase [Bdellovibrionales bacterium]|nr:ArsA family ATPase [Bdellovibrionales bacterium]